jgi:hypothetical protein
MYRKNQNILIHGLTLSLLKTAINIVLFAETRQQ